MSRKKRIKAMGKSAVSVLMACMMAVSSAMVSPVPVRGSEVWPQKSTAPFYCLDGGKGWKASDRYEIYEYDTLPSPLTEKEAKRLFWAYPSNWNALKEAARKHDPDLYAQIAAEVSGPNVVKRVKGDAGSKFAWVADNPEIEERAITALEQVASQNGNGGKEVPEAIQEATSEEKAVSFQVPPFSAGPGALNTEFQLGSAFINDIANIEAQSVWDNGSTGGNVGWLDASQDKNIARSVLGDSLYELTWSGDSIKIRNNGSVTANENAVGSTMSEEEKYNKTTVRYKITMRKESGWYTDGAWNEDYLRDWMDFKACINAPGHQRLYKADIQIVPSDMVFYLVISQDGGSEPVPPPEYGSTEPEYTFRVYRHEEEFEASYNVKLKKLDDETGMPLKGSQFYLYERFDDADTIVSGNGESGLQESRLSFSLWEGFQIFTDGVTDAKGEIAHTDVRKYSYSKTYCDGHGMPQWAEGTGGDEESEDEEEEGGDGEDGDGEDSDSEEDGEEEHGGGEEAKDKNRSMAAQWMDILTSCEEETESGDHFHWLVDDTVYEEVSQVLESGAPGGSGGKEGADAQEAFEESGCQEDCEDLYQEFINLRFTYAWKEIQARHGYILHDLHPDDQPIEWITTGSSEAGAVASVGEGSSRDLSEMVWYGSSVNFRNVRTLKTNAEVSYGVDSSRNQERGIGRIRRMIASLISEDEEEYEENDDWDEAESHGDFASALDAAEWDQIVHLSGGDSGKFSFSGGEQAGQDHWIVRDHRTEGEIHINKRDMDLIKGENDAYSSYGDTEGDAALEGAVYGLFAAEDICHPDSDILANGVMSNTGYVYRKHDLVSTATTDAEGNASFYTYTTAPGMTYNYETQSIEKRRDLDWTGPQNRYEENQNLHGNWWIRRPLILGKYYVKELSRSEGYEISVNGSLGQWTNYGSSYETPDGVSEAGGTAMVFMPELSASMEGEDGGGTGFDQLSFSVTSSGTTHAPEGRTGYELLISGLPENTEFYRVDSGTEEITAPRITGTEEVIVRDEDGNVVWLRAESDKSHIRYEPEYDENGVLTGQTVMSRMEPQVLNAWQVPQAVSMKLEDLEVEETDERWGERISEQDISEEDGEAFCFLKAELEEILNRNGYDIPVTADGFCSTETAPVYSVGVKKGEIDVFGMTTDAGEIAGKTVYGAAIETILADTLTGDSTLKDLLDVLLLWYQKNPQWSFGGIHAIEETADGLAVTVYAGASSQGNRRFFTMKQDGGTLAADKVYSVIENPVHLRWEYQEYQQDGEFRWESTRQYSFGGGAQKRYYMDVTLTPAVMVNAAGEIQEVEHLVMLYHKEGEEVIDYLSGDPSNGYRVTLTEQIDKIEITTELEYTEKDVPLEAVSYDAKTGVHRISVLSKGQDSFGAAFSDETESLTLLFMAKLPETHKILSKEDVDMLGAANVYGYQEGDVIGFAEYLLRFQGAAIAVATQKGGMLSDTYVVSKHLSYRGQHKQTEDGDTKEIPVSVVQRPIKQKIKVIKKVQNEQPVDNFRFQIYLKSNLERLYCDENGDIVWLDRDGNEVDIEEYTRAFPELVQKLYTKKTDRMLLETIPGEDGYCYEKFFDAVRTANIDQWHRDGEIWNTSWKPFVKSLISGIQNGINTSEEAKENAKRSDAVRQFATTWYLEDAVREETVSVLDGERYETKDGNVEYSDELYDKALYQAILRAEEYLKPFFQYDLDSLYAILWDSEPDGGRDRDMATLSADQLVLSEEESHAFGISSYLPYGIYVLAEQKPYSAELGDFENRHYQTDTPKEISLPLYHHEDGTIIPAVQVPWSVTEPGSKTEYSGYASLKMFNQRYQVKLRIEKLDGETGEPILHSDAVFSLYRAERNEDPYGNGEIKRYQEDTGASGSREFLEAMGAAHIIPFAKSVGNRYFGIIPKGTPVCREEDGVLFFDGEGEETGYMKALSTIRDKENPRVFQITGYVETPETVSAGTYVLAELKPPSGYARSNPIAVEVYSDAIRYDMGETKKAALRYEYGKAAFEADDDTNDTGTDTDTDEDIDTNKDTEPDADAKIHTETARIYVNNTATSLEVSKRKPADSYRAMKVSGRVEGSITALQRLYGLEQVELAYNSTGTYLGFGWKKGTLEMLQARKERGERVELVYENGVFQGYGYVTRRLDTADDENPYVPGAELALYRAICIRPTGDSEDHALEGIRVVRDRNGSVEQILAKNDNPKEDEELPVLFYDLGNLKVLDYAEDGTLYGYNKDAQKVKITFDTDSIYAVRAGRPEFEITGRNFSELLYDKTQKSFTHVPDGMVIYHLNQDLCRDAQVDGYTGLAYVETSGTGISGREERQLYVWPVVEIRDSEGELILREKILTGRAGEKYAGTADAYITGTWNQETQDFEKKMNPVYDKYGLVLDYPSNETLYKKGNMVYDRDGQTIGYRYDDLLTDYDLASFQIQHGTVWDQDIPLYHRDGEAWVIPNRWISGEQTPQDPESKHMTAGQPDLLRRVIPGTYIMEELSAPAGYVKAMPKAVLVEETAKIQRTSMTNERIKVEIVKVDETGIPIVGVELALYRANRIYTSDYQRYPKGYYLVKAEEHPFRFAMDGFVDEEAVYREALWITDGTGEYFEGIPKGDYILEELSAPTGYVPSTMELTVKECTELQSFVMANAHTKLEIFKYERDASGEKMALCKPDVAELALYPAVLDESGQPIMINGMYAYDRVHPVDVWKTTGWHEEAAVMEMQYQSMFESYGDSFSIFSWESKDERGNMRSHHARLLESHSSENGEHTTQIWELEDQSKLWIRAERNWGSGGIDGDGKPVLRFEYKYQYRNGDDGSEPDMEVYHTRDGIRHFEKIPVGNYVLVETQVPEGFLPTEPRLIVVRETSSVQRKNVENERDVSTDNIGRLVVEKIDADSASIRLSDAWFEAKNIQTGEIWRRRTNEQGQAVFEQLPVDGLDENGKKETYLYRIREILPPEGYCLHPSVWYVRLNGEERLQVVTAGNKKTEFAFSKYDMDTGKFLPGARLEIYEAVLLDGRYVAHGKAIASWISGDTSYLVTGKLTGGKTYLLTETKAPEGYAIASPFVFKVSEDGRQIITISDRGIQIHDLDDLGTIPEVKFYNKKAEDPEKEEEIPHKPEPPNPPEEPKEPEKPKEPAKPDTPAVIKPVKPKEPEPELPKEPLQPSQPEEPAKRYGRITARYLIQLAGEVSLSLKPRDYPVQIQTPQTGDSSAGILSVMGMLVSFAALVWLYRSGRKRHEEE